MTPVPEDDLERALRRALSAAANRVEPGADGLERIRARTKKRPPQPWLLAVAGGALSRARYWLWRGHWAWPDRLPRPSALPWPSSLPWPRLRRLPLAAGTLAARSESTGPRMGERLRRVFSGPDGANWLRPVGVLAGVAFIAAIALGVPSFRSTIVQVSSTVLTGGQSSGGAGTDGGGTPTVTGTPTSGGKSSAATGTAATQARARPARRPRRDVSSRVGARRRAVRAPPLVLPPPPRSRGAPRLPWCRRSAARTRTTRACPPRAARRPAARRPASPSAIAVDNGRRADSDRHTGAGVLRPAHRLGDSGSQPAQRLRPQPARRLRPQPARRPPTRLTRPPLARPPARRLRGRTRRTRHRRSTPSSAAASSAG